MLICYMITMNKNPILDITFQYLYIFYPQPSWKSWLKDRERKKWINCIKNCSYTWNQLQNVNDWRNFLKLTILTKLQYTWVIMLLLSSLFTSSSVLILSQSATFLYRNIVFPYVAAYASVCLQFLSLKLLCPSAIEHSLIN